MCPLFVLAISLPVMLSYKYDPDDEDLANIRRQVAGIDVTAPITDVGILRRSKVTGQWQWLYFFGPLRGPMNRLSVGHVVERHLPDFLSAAERALFFVDDDSAGELARICSEQGVTCEWHKHAELVH